MKKLNKIKLTALNRNEIADREQRMLKGGAGYTCGCMGVCLDELCICIEEGGYEPAENVYDRYAYSESGETGINLAHEFIYNKNLKP